MDFKAFEKITAIKKIDMCITQKIHGTNAQIVILEYPEDIEDAPEWMKAVTTETVEVDGKYYFIRCGSRSRWIYPGDDNYGFAAFVAQHKEEFIRKLGVGRHFGEWAGPGVNSGEGLAQRMFVLFDHWNFSPERELPPQTTVVPVLYQGQFDLTKIDEVMGDLKTNGSKLAPGFMRPEGVVVTVLGQRLKKVFEAEETQWKRGDEKVKALKREQENIALTKYGHLLQPIRMEKLLSRDERYIREYPATLPQICADYVADLIAEGQIQGDESEVKAARKAIGGQLFKFAKECIESRG